MERSGMLLLLALILFISNCVASRSGHGQALIQVPVVLVLNSTSMEGKMVESSVSMALSEFYAINSDYKIRVFLSVRNSHRKPLIALASDMLQTMGGNSLLEAKLLAEVREEAKVSEISLNSPTSLSLNKYGYLTQATYDSASKVKGIAAFIHRFYLNSVSLVYEDVDNWRESQQLPVDHLHEKDVCLRSKVGLTVPSREDFMKDQSQKLKDMGRSVFVVHLSGEFEINNSRLLANKFEIVNMIGSGERRIGFMNSYGSFSKLKTIIWSGGSAQCPKRRNPITKETTVERFCIEVFIASIRPFNYEVEYIPWFNGSNYNNLAYVLSSQKDKYDGAIGYISFTEMSGGFVVPKKRSSTSVFFQLSTIGLWITSATCFVLGGIIVWLIEGSKNTEYQGSWTEKIKVMLWIGFSTIVYVHSKYKMYLHIFSAN